MSLKSCRECGEQVSSKAETCPNCGVNSPTRNTKLSIALWVIAGIVFISIVVDNDVEDTTTTSADEQVEQTTDNSNQEESVDWEPVIGAVEKSKEAGYLKRIEKIERAFYVDHIMWRAIDAKTKEESVLTFARYMGYLNDLDRATGISVKDSQSGKVLAEYGTWNGVEIK